MTGVQRGFGRPFAEQPSAKTEASQIGWAVAVAASDVAIVVSQPRLAIATRTTVFVAAIATATIIASRPDNCYYC